MLAKRPKTLKKVLMKWSATRLTWYAKKPINYPTRTNSSRWTVKICVHKSFKNLQETKNPHSRYHQQHRVRVEFNTQERMETKRWKWWMSKLSGRKAQNQPDVNKLSALRCQCKTRRRWCQGFVERPAAASPRIVSTRTYRAQSLSPMKVYRTKVLLSVYLRQIQC